MAVNVGVLLLSHKKGERSYSMAFGKVLALMYKTRSYVAA